MPLDFKQRKPNTRSSHSSKKSSPKKSRRAAEPESEATGTSDHETVPSTSKSPKLALSEKKTAKQCVLSELENAENCTKEEAKKYLRDFDLLPEFGPCMNIKRSERYQRAERYGLDPPSSVMILLERFREEDPVFGASMSYENRIFLQYAKGTKRNFPYQNFR